MKRAVSHRSAFTLLEMLVALALMALLATVLYLSLHLGFDARRRTEASLAPVRSATLALEVLRADLLGAPPPAGVLAGPFLGTDARADPSAADADTLAFYSIADDVSRGTHTTRLIEVALAPAEDGHDNVLVRRITTNLLAPTTPTPVEEVLCRSVVSFNLRYFDGSTWLDTWDSTQYENELPQAVEVTLAVRTDGSGLAGAASAGAASAGTDTYQVTRIFLLPCAPPAASQEAQAAAAPTF